METQVVETDIFSYEEARSCRIRHISIEISQKTTFTKKCENEIFIYSLSFRRMRWREDTDGLSTFFFIF